MSDPITVRRLHKALRVAKRVPGVILFDLRGGPFDGCPMPCRVEYAARLVLSGYDLFLPVDEAEQTFACYLATKPEGDWIGVFAGYGSRE